MRQHKRRWPRRCAVLTLVVVFADLTLFHLVAHCTHHLFFFVHNKRLGSALMLDLNCCQSFRKDAPLITDGQLLQIFVLNTHLLFQVFAVLPRGVKEQVTTQATLVEALLVHLHGAHFTNHLRQAQIINAPADPKDSLLMLNRNWLASAGVLALLNRRALGWEMNVGSFHLDDGHSDARSHHFLEDEGCWSSLFHLRE